MTMLKTEGLANGIESIYGRLPERPEHLDIQTRKSDPSFAAGKATLSLQELIIDLGERKIILPFKSVIPKIEGKIPAIIFLNEENEIPNKYLPAEEIIDRGYAIFSLCIKDISKCDADFKSGISAYLSKSRRKKNSTGKIALWSWATLRLIEQVATLDWVDPECIILSAHGILSRPIIIAAALSDKVNYLIANSVCENPMPYCRKSPESSLTVCDYSYLYSPGFAEDPCLDELDLLYECCKEKVLLLGSAEDSSYEREYELAIRLAHGRDKNLSLENNIIPTAPYRIEEKDLSYHIRRGGEYFSREDWNVYLDFIDQKRL